MPTSESCPNRQTLERYCSGGCSEASSARLAEHLAHCDRCLAALQTLHLEESLLGVLRAAPGKPPGRAADLAVLVQRLQSLRHNAASPEPSTRESQLVGPIPVPVAAHELDFLAPAQQPDELGRLGGYRVLKILGRGGMGMVLQAEDLILRRLVAIKVLHPHLSDSPTSLQRFLREAQSVARLQHDHIVTLHQVGEERGLPFLVMELLEGESLDQRLRREGQLPISEVLRIGRETATGLAAAQQHRLIHRDIKPANLWLEGNCGRVKVLDFGLAQGQISTQNHLTQLGALLGTPGYMAPEQIQGQELDARCDLFSLGGVLYQMSTGALPFRGADRTALFLAVLREEPTPPQQLNPAVPASLAKLILQMLAKKPAERPTSAAAVATELRAIEKQQSQVTTRSGPVQVRQSAPVPTKAGTIAGEAARGISAQKPQQPPPLPSASGPVPARRTPGGLRRNRLALWLGLAIGLALLLALGIGGVRLFAPQRPQPETPHPNQQAQDWPAIPELAPNPLDALKRADLPAKELENAPEQVVTILGERKPEGKNEWAHVAFSPDRRLLVSSSQFVTKVWDTSTRKELLSVPCTSSSAFSPDGRFLALGSASNGNIRLWTLPELKENRVLSLKANARIWDLVFSPLIDSPDSRILAAGYGYKDEAKGEIKGEIKLLDVASGKELQTLTGHEKQVSSLAFSPDGKTLASGSWDYTVRGWDAKTGQELWLSTEQPIRHYAVPFSPDDGKVVAIAKRGGGGKLLDATSGKFLFPLAGEENVTDLAFRPDGRVLAGGDGKGILHFWDPATGAEQARITISAGRITGLAYSPEGRYLATAHADGSVSILRLAPAKAAPKAP